MGFIPPEIVQGTTHPLNPHTLSVNVTYQPIPSQPLTPSTHTPSQPAHPRNPHTLSTHTPSQPAHPLNPHTLSSHTPYEPMYPFNTTATHPLNISITHIIIMLDPAKRAIVGPLVGAVFEQISAGGGAFNIDLDEITKDVQGDKRFLLPVQLLLSSQFTTIAIHILTTPCPNNILPSVPERCFCCVRNGE